LAGGSLTAPIGMLKWNSLTVRIIVILIVLLAGFYVFQYTAYGKRCLAIGSCQEAAKQSGVKVGRLKIIAFMVVGAVSGLLGFFSLIRTGTSTVLTGSELFMNVLCAALLGGIPLSGGAGTKFGSAVIGSLTMAFLTNGMVLMGLSTYDKQLIKGIVFLVTIAISFDRKSLAVIK
jgi:ribose transport system permease protein